MPCYKIGSGFSASKISPIGRAVTGNADQSTANMASVAVQPLPRPSNDHEIATAMPAMPLMLAGRDAYTGRPFCCANSLSDVCGRAPMC
jgi:hypothetical protein